MGEGKVRKLRYELYPDNWEEIADWIKHLAGYKCEHCSSPSVPGKILTVHHIIDDKMNVAYNNLVALCQVCHLHFQTKKLKGQLSFFPKPDWMTKRGL